MPEGAVSLRLADYVLHHCEMASRAAVSIDGAAAKCFDIGGFLTGKGWEQKRQLGKNAWAGDYERAGKELEAHSRPGEGDVAIQLGDRRLVAECKKGPRQKSTNGQERRLLAEGIGQATKWSGESNDLVFVGVPRTAEFQRVAGDWLKSVVFQRTGIHIAFVGEDDSVACLQPETAAELDALLPAILDRAFKGEL
jgi:hypothetical protein